MKIIKIYHVYTDKFFDENIIDIIKKEFDSNSLAIKLSLEKSKNPMLCPDNVEVRIEKDDCTNWIIAWFRKWWFEKGQMKWSNVEL